MTYLMLLIIQARKNVMNPLNKSTYYVIDFQGFYKYQHSLICQIYCYVTSVYA